MSEGALPPWQRIDNFGLTAHQRVVDRINAYALLTTDPGTEVHTAPNGKGVVDKRPRGIATPAFHVQIDIAGTVAGVYYGYVWKYATGPVNMEDAPSVAAWGSIDTSEQITILNTIDLAIGTGHMLTDGTPARQVYPADRWAPFLGSDGQRVAIISQVDYKVCPP